MGEMKVTRPATAEEEEEEEAAAGAAPGVEAGAGARVGAGRGGAGGEYVRDTEEWCPGEEPGSWRLISSVRRSMAASSSSSARERASLGAAIGR
jgi:hypothetical protein